MKKGILCFLVLILLVWVGSACAESIAATITGLDDLNGRRIAVQTGTTSGPEVAARLPDAVILYTNSIADELAMLRAGKADAIVSDESMFRYMQIENEDMEILKEKFFRGFHGAGLPQD